MFESILIYGAMASGTLALLAIGFTLIFGVAQVINMAHGSLYMAGTYIFWLLTAPTVWGLLIGVAPVKMSGPIALIIAVIISGILGAIIYRVIIHPIIEDLVTVLIVTVGVALLFQSLFDIEFSSSYRSIPYLWPGTITILGVAVTDAEVGSFIVSLLLFGALLIFIRKTKIGTAMRAIAQDREVAMLMGVNNERVYMLTVGIASAFAAVAGILTSQEGFAYPFMWGTPLYFAFAIVIVGGMGSIKGTLIGAFIIGYAEQIFISSVPGVEFLGDSVALALMVVVLLLRPKGLFGRRIEMEE